MGVSTTHRINLSMWILTYSFSDTYYVWAACVQLIVEKTTFSSCLCNQAFLLSSLALSRTQTPSSAHFFFCPIDRPTITRDGVMGDEPFYWDGLAGTEMLLITSCAGLYLKYLNLNSLSGQPTLLNLQKATVC